MTLPHWTIRIPYRNASDSIIEAGFAAREAINDPDERAVTRELIAGLALNRASRRSRTQSITSKDSAPPSAVRWPIAPARRLVWRRSRRSNTAASKPRLLDGLHRHRIIRYPATRRDCGFRSAPLRVRGDPDPPRRGAATGP